MGAKVRGDVVVGKAGQKFGAGDGMEPQQQRRRPAESLQVEEVGVAAQPSSRHLRPSVPR